MVPTKNQQNKQEVTDIHCHLEASLRSGLSVEVNVPQAQNKNTTRTGPALQPSETKRLERLCEVQGPLACVGQGGVSRPCGGEAHSWERGREKGNLEAGRGVISGDPIFSGQRHRTRAEKTQSGEALLLSWDLLAFVAQRRCL